MKNVLNAVSVVIAMSISTVVVAQVSNPSMPQSVVPMQANAQPINGYVPLSQGNSSIQSATGQVDSVQRNILKEISAKKAELELLKIEADLKKYKQPDQEAVKKEESVNIAAALEQAKKEQSQAAPVEPQIPVTLLATFGMPEVPGASYAELKVGDLLVNAKVGDRLPSGHYVKAINFNSIEISKSKKAKKTETLFISASDTASVYSSRGKSGAVDNSQIHSSLPANLPPMPGK